MREREEEESALTKSTRLHLKSRRALSFEPWPKRKDDQSHGLTTSPAALSWREKLADCFELNRSFGIETCSESRREQLVRCWLARAERDRLRGADEREAPSTCQPSCFSHPSTYSTFIIPYILLNIHHLAYLCHPFRTPLRFHPQSFPPPR